MLRTLPLPLPKKILNELFSLLAIVDFRKLIWSYYTSQSHVVEKVVFPKEPSTDVDHKEYTKMEAIMSGKLASASEREENTMLD
jgi:hypothetical protein